MCAHEANPRMAHLVTTVACCFVIAGADWPQWRGPERTGMSKETGLLKSWSKSGPPLLWTFDNAGIGYSGPALVGHRLFLMGARGESEYVFALDLDPKREGKPAEVWAVKIGPTFTFKGNTWGPGPRATPTVEGDLVFALGGQGTLVCVSAASGKEVWRREL